MFFCKFHDIIKHPSGAVKLKLKTKVIARGRNKRVAGWRLLWIFYQYSRHMICVFYLWVSCNIDDSQSNVPTLEYRWLWNPIERVKFYWDKLNRPVWPLKWTKKNSGYIWKYKRDIHNILANIYSFSNIISLKQEIILTWT